MDWLNYRHLYYLWLVAREGSIARAAEQLHLAHPTISKQLHQLESSFGAKLFDRVGRNLVLTEFGQTVFRYAEEIFSVGRELQDAVQGRPSDRPLRFTVGMPVEASRSSRHLRGRPRKDICVEVALGSAYFKKLTELPSLPLRDSEAFVATGDWTRKKDDALFCGAILRASTGGGGGTS